MKTIALVTLALLLVVAADILIDGQSVVSYLALGALAGFYAGFYARGVGRQRDRT